MSTRNKLQRTQFFLDELKYSIENELYAHHYGGLRMFCILECLEDETYDGKSAKEHAAKLWIKIDKTAKKYRGPMAEEIKEKLQNQNTRV